MTRLLFVDDEPRVLQGLRQVLRTKRKIWDMVFAQGGAAALAELERTTFDAVVSDMRMPGIDGAQVLSHVREMQPGALRIVLSGQMDEAGAVRAASTAHRFLAKPCESEALITILGRALELRARLNSDEMRQCIGGMAGLPSLPATCAALNRALADECASLTDVTEIVEADVGLSAKVLQLVNSAFFGLSRQVASVALAVSYLGLNTLRSLLVANALFEGLAGSDENLMSVEQSKALLAERFARAFPLEKHEAEIAATGALLHNVGRLALVSRRAEEHARCREQARQDGARLEEVERARLGVTHAEVGAYLLGLWGLPDEVLEVVASHPAAFDRQPARLDASTVVYLSQRLAREALGEPGLPSMPDEALATIGIAPLVAELRATVVAPPGGGGA